MAELFGGMHDILLGYDTDLHFKDGDLMTTTGIDYLEREIYKVLTTSPGDWKASPKTGAGISSFIGQQNTREIGTKIKTQVEQSLISTIYPAQLQVKVIPTSEESLVVLIDIYSNGFMATRFPFKFDFVSGFKKITLRDAEVVSKKSSVTHQLNDITGKSKPNKYYERLRYQR